MLCTESDTAAYSGQFAKARELTRRASTRPNGRMKRDGGGLPSRSGNARRPGRQHEPGKAASPGRTLARPAEMSKGCLRLRGLAGDSAQATRLEADLAKRFPEDTIVQFDYLPMIHAATALQSGNGNKAIEALAPTVPYELGSINWATLCIRSICVAQHTWRGSKAAQRQPSSRKSSTIRAWW